MLSKIHRLAHRHGFKRLRKDSAYESRNYAKVAVLQECVVFERLVVIGYG